MLLRSASVMLVLLAAIGFAAEVCAQYPGGQGGTGGPGGGPLTAGSLVLEPGRHEARVGDTPLTLTPTEFRLLEALVRAGGDIVPHLQLARAGWPAETDPDLLWLKPHLARLRSKVQAAGGPQVVAVRGVGYRILVEENVPA
jgi:DNA-binding response OmpR family regulator